MPKRVDPLARRHSIAEAVFRLAAARGADAVSLRDVAGEAGVSLGMVQHYFRSKDEMLLFALDHMRDRVAGGGPVSGTWRTPGPVTSSARYSPSCCLPTRTREPKRSSPSRSTPGRPSPPPTRPPFGTASRTCSASSPNSCAPPSTAATQDRASTPGRRPRPCSGLPTAWSGRFSSASAHLRPPSHCSTTNSTGSSSDRHLSAPKAPACSSDRRTEVRKTAASPNRGMLVASDQTQERPFLGGSTGGRPDFIRRAQGGYWPGRGSP